MLNATREQIYGALFTLVSGAANFKYATRRVLLWDQVPQERRPALIQVENEEKYTQESTGQPPLIDCSVTLLVYVWSKQNMTNDEAPPISLLNPYIDAIDTVLRPDPVTWTQSLGGLVNHCWIEGTIHKISGDLDGDSVAIIPVRLLVPA